MYKILHFLLGDAQKTSQNIFLARGIQLIVLVVAILVICVNGLLDIPWQASAFAALGGLLYGSLYFLSRLKNWNYFSIFSVTYLLMLLVNTQWFFNYGSKGPVLFLFIVVQISSMLVFSSRFSKILFFFVLILNVAALFFLEYLYPDWIGGYSSEQYRLMDLFVGFLIYIGISTIIIYAAKSFYKRQEQKAIAADKLKTAFLANMSHEIRTPMNAIQGFLQLLSKAKDENKRTEYLKIIQENSRYLLQLMDDIIDISKIEADQLEMVNSKVSIKEVMGELKQILLPWIQKLNKGHLRIDYFLSHEALTLETDKLRLKQVLLNLLTNALKFTEQGQIIVGCQIVDSRALFFVEDTGIGIAPEQQKVIFERFFTTEDYSTVKSIRGVGLGLSITHKLVQLLGGNLIVNSQKGEGARFEFSLPLSADSISIKESEMYQPGAFHFEEPTILVAEDDDYAFLLVAELLSENNMQVIRAKTGIEAIEHCKHNKTIDLVLMDIRMPTMNGLEATKKIKEDHPLLPIIIQTAFALDTDKNACYNAGCDWIMFKPLDPAELIKAIYNLISR